MLYYSREESWYPAGVNVSSGPVSSSIFIPPTSDIVLGWCVVNAWWTTLNILLWRADIHSGPQWLMSNQKSLPPAKKPHPGALLLWGVEDKMLMKLDVALPSWSGRLGLCPSTVSSVRGDKNKPSLSWQEDVWIWLSLSPGDYTRWRQVMSLLPNTLRCGLFSETLEVGREWRVSLVEIQGELQPGLALLGAQLFQPFGRPLLWQPSDSWREVGSPTSLSILPSFLLALEWDRPGLKTSLCSYQSRNPFKPDFPVSELWALLCRSWGMADS
jgi:hypothetical protein